MSFYVFLGVSDIFLKGVLFYLHEVVIVVSLAYRRTAQVSTLRFGLLRRGALVFFVTTV